MPVFMSMLTGMVVLEDEEIQKKGLAVVVYLVGAKRKLDRQAAWRFASLASTIPYRYESGHICYDDPRLVPFFTVGMLSAGSFYRVRTRIHYGTSKRFSSTTTTEGRFSPLILCDD
jgi:hypothetical protein